MQNKNQPTRSYDNFFGFPVRELIEARRISVKCGGVKYSPVSVPASKLPTGKNY